MSSCYSGRRCTRKNEWRNFWGALKEGRMGQTFRKLFDSIFGNKEMRVSVSLFGGLYSWEL